MCLSGPAHLHQHHGASTRAVIALAALTVALTAEVSAVSVVNVVVATDHLVAVALRPVANVKPSRHARRTAESATTNAATVIGLGALTVTAK